MSRCSGRAVPGVALVLGVVVLIGLVWWNLHGLRQPSGAAPAVAEAADEIGFVALPPTAAAAQHVVLVVAARNCPAEDARRADDLARALAARGVPVRRVHEVFFRFRNRQPPDRATRRRMDAVMRGRLPIVFVGERASNNPDVEAVIEEFGLYGTPGSPT